MTVAYLVLAIVAGAFSVPPENPWWFRLGMFAVCSAHLGEGRL